MLMVHVLYAGFCPASSRRPQNHIRRAFLWKLFSTRTERPVYGPFQGVLISDKKDKCAHEPPSKPRMVGSREGRIPWSCLRPYAGSTSLGLRTIELSSHGWLSMSQQTAETVQLLQNYVRFLAPTSLNLIGLRGQNPQKVGKCEESKLAARLYCLLEEIF